MDAYPYRFHIVKGEQDRFLLPGWELDSAASFNALVQKLIDLGLSMRKLESDHEAQCRQVRKFAKAADPTGASFEFFYGMRLDYEPLISTCGGKDFCYWSQWLIWGLGHIAISTPDIATSHQFLYPCAGFCAKPIICTFAFQTTSTMQVRAYIFCTAIIHATTAWLYLKIARCCRVQ